MPLIILTGYPSSGKTTRCQEIKEYLEKNCNKKVHVVSEENILSVCDTDKNKLYYGENFLILIFINNYHL